MKRIFFAVLLALAPSVALAQYRGDVAEGETLTFCFNTVGSTGAPITIAGTPEIEVYEEGSITQITAGDTFTEDFDGVTGLHMVQIAATTANGYEVGKWYDVIIAGTTPTADSVSILGRTVGTFRVVAAETSAGTPKTDVSHWLGTAAATPTQAGVPEVDVTFIDGAVTSNTLITQADITGGGYALDTDANGRIRIVDGTATGELDTTSGTVLLSSATEAQIDAIEADTNELQTDDTPGAIAALNNVSTAQILAALGLQSTTVNAWTSVTNWTLTAGSTNNSAYKDWTAIIVDAGDATDYMVIQISDYTGSGKVVAGVVAADNAGFTPTNGDLVILRPPGSSSVQKINGYSLTGDGQVATEFDVE